jgi:hypothetical protein
MLAMLDSLIGWDRQRAAHHSSEPRDTKRHFHIRVKLSFWASAVG